MRNTSLCYIYKDKKYLLIHKNKKKNDLNRDKWIGVGGKFEELRAIIDRVKSTDKVGVCLDTCHVFDAGYDIVNDLDGVLKKFDEIIGLKRLKAVHLNDGKNPLGSHKDRHEKLGRGHIGAPALKRLINHPLLRDLPFYLETPNELDGYAREIALLKSWRE